MSPLLLSLIVAVAGTTTDRNDISLDYAVFLASDSVQRIELTCAIPYTSLTFVRESTDYVARFTLRFSGWDAKGNLKVAQDWDREVREAEYDSTMRRRQIVSERESVRSACVKLNAEVVFQDQQSERTRTWKIKTEPPLLLSDIRLEERPARRAFEARDIVHGYFEVYDRNHTAESAFTRVTKDRRVWAAERSGIPHDSWPSRLNFAFPLKDFENGTYEVRIEALSPAGKVLAFRQTSFPVENSFFLSTREYQEKVGQLLYIATAAEIEKLRKAPVAQRESLWHAFWQEKDQTPTTQENETEREYLDRINYAIEHFGHGDRGYRSDRAHVYVKLGPPDNVESLPFETHSNAYEIWYYYSQNLKFTFLDVNGFGEYKLVDPSDYFQRQG